MLDRRAFIAAAAGLPAAMLAGTPARAATLDDAMKSNLKSLQVMRGPVTDASFDGRPVLVTFWASWCPPCRAEHPTLHRLAEEGIQLYGINFKDETAQANGYLDDDGNPFLGIAYDPKGRTAIDWGVTAPPETFIIGGDGTVLYKFIGPLVGSDYEQRFRPELEKALEAAR